MLQQITIIFNGIQLSFLPTQKMDFSDDIKSQPNIFSCITKIVHAAVPEKLNFNVQVTAIDSLIFKLSVVAAFLYEFSFRCLDYFEYFQFFFSSRIFFESIILVYRYFFEINLTTIIQKNSIFKF